MQCPYYVHLVPGYECKAQSTATPVHCLGYYDESKAGYTGKWKIYFKNNNGSASFGTLASVWSIAIVHGDIYVMNLAFLKTSCCLFSYMPLSVRLLPAKLWGQGSCFPVITSQLSLASARENRVLHSLHCVKFLLHTSRTVAVQGSLLNILQVPLAQWEFRAHRSLTMPRPEEGIWEEAEE